MKKTFNLRKTFTILFLLFTTLACFVLSLNAYTGNAAATVETAEITMEPGAQVRLAGLIDDRIGIRWQLKMSASEYNDIEDDSVSYGILIAPNDYGALTENSVFKENGAFWWKDINGVAQNKAENKKQIWNLETDELTVKDGIAYFYGSLVDINPVNISREFNAVGYMKYIVGGQAKYKFASENDTVRSMTCVALRYLESGANEFTPKEEEAFRAQYVKEKEISVVFNFDGEIDTRNITLAVSETYTANDLAKIAGIGLSGYVSSVDCLSSVKVTDDMSSITDVKFESVASKDLAGTYALAENKNLKLDFDGTASVVEGDKITSGNWKMVFDRELHSTVAMIAMDTADNSFVAQIEKITDASYALVKDGAIYAQAESGIKTLIDGLAGAYKLNKGGVYDCSGIDTSWYDMVVIDATNNTIKLCGNTGQGGSVAQNLSGLITTVTNTFGKINISSIAGAGDAYYTKIDGEYYLYFSCVLANVRHVMQYYKTTKFDDTAIREKLVGEYYVDITNYPNVSVDFVISDDTTAIGNKTVDSSGNYGGAKLSNAMLVSKGATGGQIGSGSYGCANTLNIIPTSNTTGYLRFAQANNGAQALDPKGLLEYVISGENVIIAGDASYDFVVMKRNGDAITSTTKSEYFDALKYMLMGDYVATNSTEIHFDSDGSGEINGHKFTCKQIVPNNIFDNGNRGSIYKGDILINIDGIGDAYIKYDFTSGKTFLTATNENGIAFDALQIG